MDVLHYLYLLSLALLAYSIAWLIYARTVHPLSKIPGLFWPSITRLWFVYHVAKGDMDVVQRDLHRQYGPLLRIAPNEVACSDPEALKKIYPTQSPLTKTDFYPIWTNKTFSKYPDNFSGTDEKLHAERRRIVNNVYSMSTVLTLEPYLDRCSALFLERMGERADSKQGFDLGVWLQWSVHLQLLSSINRSRIVGMPLMSSASFSLGRCLDSWSIRTTMSSTSTHLTPFCRSLPQQELHLQRCDS